MDQVAEKHLRVYIAADKFGILPLRELAATRIATWIHSNWSSGIFPDIVESIWRLSPILREKLQDAIIETVAANVQPFLAQQRGRQVVLGNPELAIAIVRRESEKVLEIAERCNRLVVQQSRRNLRDWR